jgi:uncharacterized membrane protein
MNWTEMTNPAFQMLAFLVYVGIDLGRDFYQKLGNASHTVGVLAHAFGGLSGLLISVIILKNFKVLNWERRLWWFSLILFITLFISGICFHIFYPEHFDV